MQSSFILALLALLMVAVNAQTISTTISTALPVGPTCFTDPTGAAALVSGPYPGLPGVTIAVTTLPGIGYSFQASGYSLSVTMGGPTTSRGVVVIPDDNVEGGAYAPYASGIASGGYYVVLLGSITGMSDSAVFGAVVEAVNTNPNLVYWGVVGHGRGGSLASTAVSLLQPKFKGLGLLGALSAANLSNTNNIAVVNYFSTSDTVVPASSVQAQLSTIFPGDAYGILLTGTAHYDYAFSTCTGNSASSHPVCPLRFQGSPAVPSFNLPPKNSGTRVAISTGRTIATLDQAPLAGVNCRRQSISVVSGGSGINPDDLQAIFQVGSNSNGVTTIYVDTNTAAYAADLNALVGAEISLTIECDSVCTGSCVLFLLNGSLPTSNAAANLGGIVSNFQTLAGLMHFPAPSQNAYSYLNNSLLYPNLASVSKPYAQGTYQVTVSVVAAPLENPLVPIPRSWWVFTPALNPPLGGIVYRPGAAVDGRSYAPLMFEIASRGYTCVVIQEPLRDAVINVTLPYNVITSPLFANVPSSKWVIAGHSLGGIGAAWYMFVYNYTVASLVMHAGGVFPFTPLNAITQRIAQIYGTLDHVGGEEYEPPADRYRTSVLPFVNPANLWTVVVPGANHYQIGDYGYQYDDLIATISLQDQHTAFAVATVNFLDYLQAFTPHSQYIYLPPNLQ